MITSDEMDRFTCAVDAVLGERQKDAIFFFAIEECTGVARLIQLGARE